MIDQKQYLAVKLGIDVHADSYVVVPQDWDEQGRGVKSDSLDALALCQRLDRYVGGNRKAFTVVHVPSLKQERQRARCRLREQIQKHRKSLQGQGRSLLLTQDIRVKGQWWQGTRWRELEESAPQWVLQHLSVLRELLQAVCQQEKALTEELEQDAPKALPRGIGALTYRQLGVEMCDWSRFNNRRQVSSYTGLCPSEHSSGKKRRQGHITKHGNPRVRAKLVECAWRLVRYQPNYPPIQKFRAALLEKKTSPAARKKAIVAVARRLAVDLWRLFTDQTTPEQIGLLIKPQIG
ncbi:IS110 family transposase [Cerasicoccus maritimus]|uniref:IS110 family transposase n=1 Tax=Cerasicoccus maritimus TaxID=490089 RepID=UPI0028528475|nr:IS110 family transposase [Cerasicoccus maritimus]